MSTNPKQLTNMDLKNNYQQNFNNKTDTNSKIKQLPRQKDREQAVIQIRGNKGTTNNEQFKKIINKYSRNHSQCSFSRFKQKR